MSHFKGFCKGSFSDTYIQCLILLACAAAMLLVIQFYSNLQLYTDGAIKTNYPFRVNRTKNIFSGKRNCKNVYTTQICDGNECKVHKGKPMDEKHCNMMWTNSEFIELNKSTIDDFVFVTAASENHTIAVLYSLATVQKYFKARRTILYDIGITSDKSIQKIKSMENVEYKKLDFNKYPPHVQYLRHYNWKPLVMFEELQKYPAVFWIDASVRFREEALNLSHLFNYVLTNTNGFVLFGNNAAPHSNGHVTHPTTYSYIPSDMARQKRTTQYASGTMLVYRTKWVMDNIFHWFGLCALDRECMAPKGAQIDCGRFYKCHRYDQAVINLLLTNACRFNTSQYVYPGPILRITWEDVP